MMNKEKYFGAEKVDLAEVQFTPELLRCIPTDLARHYRVLPVFDDSPISLCIALADPSDLDAIDSLHFKLQRDLHVRVADAGQLDELIQRLYGV